MIILNDRPIDFDEVATSLQLTMTSTKGTSLISPLVLNDCGNIDTNAVRTTYTQSIDIKEEA